jgi:magnesium chelatase subunit D
VVRRRLAYDADPDGFAERWAQEEKELAVRITAARALLPSVVLGDPALRQITAVCAAFEVDGLRADIVMARTAVALAAWAGRTDVIAEDVRTAAQLALPHRRRRNPFDAPGLDEEKLEQTLEQSAGEEPDGGPEDDGPGPEGPPDGGGPDGPSGGGQDAPEQEREASGEEAEPAAPSRLAPAPPQPAAPAASPYRTRLLTVPGLGEGAGGRRSRARTDTGGHTVRAARPTGALQRLHLAATIQAAAPHQLARGRDGRALRLRRDDFREQVREGRESNLVLFVVDASGSMAARQRMSAVKGAVLSLLMDAYQRRDKIGMVTFRGSDAVLALPPTSSVEVGAARLEQLPTGGRTPLAAGLLRAHETLRLERLRDPRRRPLLVVVTDGRATGGPQALPDARRAAQLLAAQGTAAVVVDCESGPVRLGLAAELAQHLAGEAVRLDELAADSVTHLVTDLIGTKQSRNKQKEAA